MAVFNEDGNPNISALGSDSIYNSEFNEDRTPKLDESGKSLVGTISWDLKTGKNVEDYITRRLNNTDDLIEEVRGEFASAIEDVKGSEIVSGTYSDSWLTLNKQDSTKDPIKVEVTVVPPNYSTVLTFSQIKLDGSPKTGDIEVNYTGNTTFLAGFNVKTYYESTGNFYDISNKISVTFYIDGTTESITFTDVVPNKKDDDSLQFRDITPLFLNNLEGVTIVATVTENGKTDTISYPGTVTVHKIELSTSSTHVADKKVVFNIKNLNSTSNMKLEYYDVPLGTTDLNSIERKSIPITSNTRAELELSIGGHQILARVSNNEGTYYSNWIQANVVSHDKQNKTNMMAIIGGVPDTINNCENAKMFQIISVPGLGGDVEIVSYLSDDAGIFEDDQSTWPEFNRTSLSTNANDTETVSDYYSYIELTNIKNNSSKAIAFSLVVNGNSYNLYSLQVVNNRLSGKKVFNIKIQENPYNVNGAFNYVPGAIEDFSQITGQGTTLFSDVNSDIESSDGWTTDENLIAFKVSGQDRNLFKSPKNFDQLLTSADGFTIEVMLKNYNINGDDPVMNIGSLLFGPGYTRVQSANEEIYTNSRADFEKEVITHLMFVYDPTYKPSTYNNIYDQLFNEPGLKYSDFLYSYPILKVYVNGTINREIEISPADLENEEGFRLQINPKSSDLNLYILRTYNQAFNYQLILKNYISSRSTALEKKEIYDRNDILDSDGRVSFYKTMLNNNVIVVVIPETDKPLYFGNRKTNGDGIDPSGQVDEEGDPLPSKATLLVHYKNPDYAAFSGRFTEGKYKAQGSSAKKYMIHNVQYSKGKFISEADLAEGKTKTSKTYAMPTDIEKVAAKKFVGKVNYASSMQSHKLGSVKLFDRAYKDKVFKSNYPEKLYTGGKKSCLEEAFVYFYYNLKPGQDINTITINDIYSTKTGVGGVVIADDKDVKFFGFQTWGSGKADDPTFGYRDDTLEYLLVEGADNGSTGANFKQPWAAFLTWTPTINYDDLKGDARYIIQQTKEITDPTSETYDPTAGLVIDGETIKFDANGTDPWDIDYGVTELDEDKDLWKFTDEVKAKGSSLHHWVAFYNNCYTYDFTNLIPNPNANPVEFELFNKYGLDDHRIYMTRNNVKLLDKDAEENIIESGTAETFETFRWDSRINKWVRAGLHHNGSDWEPFKLNDVFRNIKSTELYNKYKDNKDVMNTAMWSNIDSIGDKTDVENFVLPAFRDMFKAGIEEYCDKEDLIYHQAFIRLVSGTDNRAKNTYFQIIGKLYTNKATVNDVEVDLVKIAKGDHKKKKGYISDGTFHEVSIDGDVVSLTGFTLPEEGLEVKDLYWKQTEEGDYKIRLMQDDMDTIFATDNNGQLVKPYYLLEPPFNKDTEKMWGDHHSSFFYPFDMCYYREINNMVGQIIDYLVGSATTIKDKNTLLYDYFFKTQLEFPEILYNHHAEIYYEMPQVLFKEGTINAFNNTISGFANNSVQYPLSLSHGRCIESEYQFMKDRLLLLGTQSNSAHGLYGSEWQLSTEGSGGNEGGTTLRGVAEYTDYFYPNILFKRSSGEEYTKLVNLTNPSEVGFKYTDVFTYVMPETVKIPSTVAQMVTPDREYSLAAAVDTTITSYITSSLKIKDLHITAGLDVMHYLPTLPSVKSLKIDGISTNYSINSINIVVKNYLPIIEVLTLTNTPFSQSILDFRNCNRLSEIDLKGCTGIKNIILPENNRLSKVNLPSGLKQISLGVNPNLSEFNIPEETKFNSFSLDCSRLNENFDYINILNNHLDANLTSIIINNTPEEGLVITEDIANMFAKIQNDSSIQKSIKGTFVIKERIETTVDRETVYSWGDVANISYSTKKNLVKAFGDIDDVNNAKNSVHFKYESTALQRDSYKISDLIALDTPEGGQVWYPFDELYFTLGNDVAVSEGKLNIKYEISGLPNTCEFDTNTGRLYVNANTESSYSYSITVTRKNGTSLTPIKGTIFLGYKEPEIGDYAYADGTFSSSFTEDKPLVGLVYQKQVITNGSEWKLGILSCDTVSGYSGPDYYYYNNGQFSDLGNEQQLIYNFMKNSEGLNISMTNPNPESYLGFAPETDTNNTIINLEYKSKINTSLLVKSGKEDTYKLVDIVLSRIEFLVQAYPAFKSYLKNYFGNDNGLIDDLNKLIIDKWTPEIFEEVCNKLNEIIVSLDFTKNINYSKVLHPLSYKTYLYSPENLSDKGSEYYAKGNWYIPSMNELELLIYYRIASTCNPKESTGEAYWNLTSYDKGQGSDAIFSKTYNHFYGFLNDSKMIAAEVSRNNKNFVYAGLNDYYSSGQMVYKWFNSYTLEAWVVQTQDCCRDNLYTITPCCTITVTKN